MIEVSAPFLDVCEFGGSIPGSFGKLLCSVHDKSILQFETREPGGTSTVLMQLSSLLENIW